MKNFSDKFPDEQLSYLHGRGAVHLRGVLSPAWLRYMEAVVEDRVQRPWWGSVPAKLLGGLRGSTKPVHVYGVLHFRNLRVPPV